MNQAENGFSCFPDLTNVAGAVWLWLETLISEMWGGLTWPHAVLIIFAVTVYCFRPEIKGVIPRIKRVGADGFELDATPPPQTNTAPSAPQPAPLAEFPTASSIVADLLDNQVQGVPEESRFEFVRRDAIGWRVVSYFESTYSQIFGGQLQLLKLLNERGDSGFAMVEVEREWEAYKERFKPALDGWLLEPFIGFLLAKGLISKEDSKLSITPLGKEFMIWMAKFGRSEQRMW